MIKVSTDHIDINSPFLTQKQKRNAYWESLGNGQRKKLLAEVHNLNYRKKISHLHNLIDRKLEEKSQDD